MRGIGAFQCHLIVQEIVVASSVAQLVVVVVLGVVLGELVVAWVLGELVAFVVVVLGELVAAEQGVIYSTQYAHPLLARGVRFFGCSALAVLGLLVQGLVAYCLLVGSTLPCAL